MGMPPLATWKYRGGEPLSRRAGPSGERIIVVSIVLMLTVTATLHAALPADPAASPSRWLPVAAGAAVIAALTLFRTLLRGMPTGTRIGLNNRYLVCAGEIVYFANVASATLDLPQGTLALVSLDERTVRLYQAGFVSNANKPEKIAANQRRAFLAVSERILELVGRASPGAQITRIPPTGA